MTLHLSLYKHMAYPPAEGGNGFILTHIHKYKQSQKNMESKRAIKFLGLMVPTTWKIFHKILLQAPVSAETMLYLRGLQYNSLLRT